MLKGFYFSNGAEYVKMIVCQLLRSPQRTFLLLLLLILPLKQRQTKICEIVQQTEILCVKTREAIRLIKIIYVAD